MFSRTEKLAYALFVAFMALMAVAADSCAQTNFVIPRAMGQGGFATNIRPAPTYVNARVLAANVAETSTLPADTRLVIFSADCNFYAKPGASAAVATDITDGTASELNPAAWYFTNAAGATQQVTVIAASTCNVTLSAYKGMLQ